MRPITVLTAIILGSCVAISVCLLAVWLLLTLVSSDPAFAERVAAELKLLPQHVAIFLPLTAIAAMTFLSSQKEKPTWWMWQLFMWATIFLIGAYYFSQLGD